MKYCIGSSAVQLNCGACCSGAGNFKSADGKMVEIFYIPKFVFVFCLNLCKYTAASENSHVSITSAKVRNIIFQLK
jgi:hypothetical protein